MSRVARSLPALLVLAAAHSLASCFECDDEADLSCGGSSHRSTSCTIFSGCDEAFYWGGLALDLPPLADGNYVLEGSADGAPFSCPVAVTGGLPDVRCSDWQVAWVEADRIVGLAAAPCDVTIALRDGQDVLASGAFRPDFVWDQPTGEGCEWRGLAHVALTPASR